MDEIDPNLTILGIIPSITSGSNNNKNRKKISVKTFKKKINSYKKLLSKKQIITSGSNSAPIRHLVTYTDPKSPISEAYRSLRTSLSYSSSGDQFKSLIITSTGPGEGKTTTISNLAITYANLGKRVLLIDTDLRRPVLHKVFNLKNKNHGISNFLTGQVDEINKIINNTEIENLNVITAGIIPPNPSELLSSKKMKDLILSLQKDYDMVLLDSPPLVAVTDASILAQATDKLAIVVMPGKTDKKAFTHSIQALENMRTKIDGIIFNGVDSKNSYGSYYYYYQYYNYYGTKE